MSETRRGCGLLSTFALVGCAGVSGAPQEPAPHAAAETAAREAGEPWKPLVPAQDEADWIRLKSGEWLKGEIDVLTDETLEFDSAELDELKIDWEDVVEVRTTRPFTVRRTDLSTTIGALVVRDGVVVVRGDAGEQRYPRAALDRAVPGEPRERNYWSGHLTLGGTVRSGNTDQTDTSLSLSLLRRTTASRLTLAVDSIFGKLDGEDNVDNQRLNGQYDRFVTSRFYVTPFGLDVFRDPFQNIDRRVTPYAGVGYALVDSSRFDWDLIVGAGYRFTRFDSVEEDEDETDEEATGIVGTRMEADLTKKIEWALSYDAFVSAEDTNDTDQNLTTAFSVDVVGDLDFDLAFTWRRAGAPEADSDGDVPDKDDFRIDIGLGWEF